MITLQLIENEAVSLPFLFLSLLLLSTIAVVLFVVFHFLNSRDVNQNKRPLVCVSPLFDVIMQMKTKANPFTVLTKTGYFSCQYGSSFNISLSENL